MLIDARSLAEGEILTTPVCIIGGGAAGITLAMEFAKSGTRACLLESGGLEPDAETQSLYRGELEGHAYAPFNLETSRLRYFGGSTNHWEGACRPLDEIDFQARPWVPHSGWPITRFELIHHYERAQELCQLGPFHYSGKAWLAGGAGELGLSPLAFRTGIQQFSPPTRFGIAYREPIVAAEKLRLILHANALELVADPDSTEVKEVRVATLGDRSFRVRARYFVLAAGAVENARLLLVSRGRGDQGLGNERGLVGRYFQEHPQLETAGYFTSTAPGFEGSFYLEHARDGTRIRGLLTPEGTFLRREKLPSFCIGLQPTEERFAGALAPPIQDLAAALDGTGDEPAAARNFRIFCRVEQLPNPESRVLLGEEKDPFGMPRARLVWGLQSADLENLRRALQAFANEVGSAGLGRVKLQVYDESLDWGAQVRPRGHQMGTTRMADDATRGVVDADARVHGLDNLYVAGSSVFPTSGYAGPTLTLVALSVRLADLLRDQLRRFRQRKRRD